MLFSEGCKAMGGTNTWAVRLTGYFVGADQLIADPVRPYSQARIPLRIKTSSMPFTL